MKKILSLLGSFLLMAILSGCGTTKINLNDYIVTEETGFDGRGRVNILIDYERFHNDYDGKIEAKNLSGDMVLEAKLGADPVTLLLNYCVGKNDEANENLSNGDKVKLTWRCQDEKAKRCFNVELEYEDVEITVSGLEEVKTFDPFEGIEIEYSGVSPNLKVSIKRKDTSDIINGMNFWIDGKSEKYQNGESVKVICDYGWFNEDTLIDRYGMIPNKFEQEYLIEGKPYLITEATQMSNEVVQKLASDYVAAYDYNQESRDYAAYTVNSIDLQDTYLLENTGFESYLGIVNRVVQTFRVEATDQNGEDFTIWRYEIFYQVAMRGDEVEYESMYHPKNDMFYITEWFVFGDNYYAGFTTEEEMLDLYFFKGYQSGISSEPSFNVYKIE